MRILGKVPRHPIQNHTQPHLVTPIHKPAELIRIPKPACRSIITRHLISPGAIKRMLGHPHELNVSETKTRHIRNQVIRHLPPRLPAIVLMRHPFPRPRMHLINTHRRRVQIPIPQLHHPLPITPGISLQIKSQARRLRSMLREKGKWIALRHRMPFSIQDLKLVMRPRPNSRQKDLPNARFNPQPHRVHSPIPLIEITHHTHPPRIWRPHRKLHSRHTIQRLRMRTKTVIQPSMRAFAKVIHVLLA